MSGNIGCWFEIPTKDIAKAAAFYEKSFNVKLTPDEMGPFKMAMFPMEERAEGTGGALVNGPDYVPSHLGSMVYLAVEEIDSTLKLIANNGGKTLMPKTSIGKYGFVAHFQDIDGNRVGIFSMK